MMACHKTIRKSEDFFLSELAWSLGSGSAGLDCWAVQTVYCSNSTTTPLPNYWQTTGTVAGSISAALC